jgi:hypothetical protein
LLQIFLAVIVNLLVGVVNFISNFNANVSAHFIEIVTAADGYFDHFYQILVHIGRAIAAIFTSGSDWLVLNELQDPLDLKPFV